MLVMNCHPILRDARLSCIFSQIEDDAIVQSRVRAIAGSFSFRSNMSCWTSSDNMILQCLKRICEMLAGWMAFVQDRLLWREAAARFSSWE